MIKRFGPFWKCPFCDVWTFTKQVQTSVHALVTCQWCAEQIERVRATTEQQVDSQPLTDVEWLLLESTEEYDGTAC